MEDKKIGYCPFCGLPAVLHVVWNKKCFYCPPDPIPKDWKKVQEGPGARFPSGIVHYNIEYDVPSYIPMCSDPRCLGRLTKRFHTAEEAIEAFNRRAEAKKEESK